MSEGLDKLRSIGAQKIHEDTHISLNNIHAILDENFEKAQKIQLLGFVSILEREYKVNLESLREKAKEYFEVIEESHIPKDYLKEEKPSLPTKHKLLIAFLIVVLVIMVGNFYFISSDKSEDKVSPALIPDSISKEENNSQDQIQVVDEIEENVTEETAKKNKMVLTEANTTDFEIDKPLKQQKEKFIPQKLIIIPKTKVWLGYIDLTTHKKRQTVTKNPIELNASKNYLLTFGHGYIDIKIGDKIENFKKAKSIKFVYEDGVLKEISNDEFKARNKGKLW